jgi:uracil phosphoribosyltransferase
MLKHDPRDIRGEELKALTEQLLEDERLAIIGDHPLAVDAITRMRERDISQEEYERSVRIVADLLIYKATERLSLKDRQVALKNGSLYQGGTLDASVILVPIMRAGLPMEEEAGRVLPGASVGFVVAERDEQTGRARVTSCKLPMLKGKKTFLLEQVVATGDTVCKVLAVAKGEYQADDITLLCCIAAPQGVFRIFDEHPDVEIFLGHLDETLDDDYFVYPGVGDAGDRTFGIYHKPHN